MYLFLCAPEPVPTMFRISKILKITEHLLGGFLEALTN